MKKKFEPVNSTTLKQDPAVADLENDLLEEAREAKVISGAKKVAQELSDLWEKISDDDKKLPAFENIAGFNDPGKQLLERELEIIEHDSRSQHLSHEEKMQRIQTAIDIVSGFRDKAKNVINGSEKEFAGEFGSEGENIESLMDGKKVSRAQKIEQLRKEIEIERKDYLELDYKKNTALKRVRKFFGNISFGKKKEGDEHAKEKGYEQDAELAQYRAYYDNKLFELQKLLIEDAKEKGASDEELAQLYIEFQKEQKITMAEEHDKVKVEQQEGRIRGIAGEKMVEISKWYRGLSRKKQLAIGLSFAAGGFAVAGAGAAVGSTFASLVIARRMFGGMTTGVGTALSLEAKGKMKDAQRIEKIQADFLEMLKNAENMTEDQRRDVLIKYDTYKKSANEDDAKYEDRIKEAISAENFKYTILSEGINGVAIKDSENMINKIKNQDLRQLASGVAMGTFTAVVLPSIFREYADDALYWVREKLGFFDYVENDGKLMQSHRQDNMLESHGPAAEGYRAHVENAPSGGSTYGNLVDADGSGVKFSEQLLNKVDSIKVANFEVEKGSSFEGAIIKYLKEHQDVLAKINSREGFENLDAGQIAHNLAIKFAQEHAGFPEGELPDIVQPGQKMTLDLEKMKITVPEGSDIRYIPNEEVADAANESESDNSASDSETEDGNESDEDTEDATPKTDQPLAEEALNQQPKEETASPTMGKEPATRSYQPNNAESIPYNEEHDFKKIETEIQAEEGIEELNEAYRKAVDPSNFNSESSPYENHGGLSSNEGDKLSEYDNLNAYERLSAIEKDRNNLRDLLATLRTEDVPWQGIDSIEELVKEGAGPKQILKSSMEKITENATQKSAYWAEIKNKPFADVAFENGTSKFKPEFNELLNQFRKVIGEQAIHKEGETTAKWLKRVTILALQKS